MPDVYEEEPPSPSPSLATKKLQNDAFEKVLAEITTDSDIADMGPEGKTPEEIDAIIPL